jgi:nucleoside-diphosphate-sugar epimerase
MRIRVTGAAGLLGAYVMRRLDGSVAVLHTVTGFDR